MQQLWSIKRGSKKRKLEIRTKEHRADVKKKNGDLSVISEYRLKNNHDFKWDEVEILDIEPSYYKRLLSEIIYIAKQAYGINNQSNIHKLPAAYSPILDIILSS